MTLTRVSILLFLTLSSTACVREVIVEKPVPVEVVRVERIPIPAELTREIPPETIPDGASFGRALELWALDREHLMIVNGRLRALAELQ